MSNAETLGIPEIEQGWFTETETLWPGQKFSLALEGFNQNSVLYHKHSRFQSILVFKSAQYGNVLVLDGVIQLTERDEFAYHEMMVHIPLNAHAKPRRILIVGGGDGGILREVCKHDTVQEIVMVEIDPQVIEVAQTYFCKSTARPECFADPRLSIVHADAADFLKSHAGNYYDIIIGDSSDPVGPADSLFQPAFYESMHAVLRDGGIVCMQAESFWIHLDLISDIHACCMDIFDSAEYATTMVPTYPCGQIGFLLAQRRSSRQEVTCSRPVRQPPFVRNLKWYSPQIHQASFVLPPFVKRRLHRESSFVSKGQVSPLGTTSSELEDGGVYDDDQEADLQRRCFLDGILCLFQKWWTPTTDRALVVPDGRNDDDDDDDGL